MHHQLLLTALKTKINLKCVLSFSSCLIENGVLSLERPVS